LSLSSWMIGMFNPGRALSLQPSFIDVKNSYITKYLVTVLKLTVNKEKLFQHPFLSYIWILCKADWELWINMRATILHEASNAYATVNGPPNILPMPVILCWKHLFLPNIIK
jgi:hypothetical protein